MAFMVRNPKRLLKVDTSDATPLKVPAPQHLSTDFTRIAKEVGPAVVNISTVQLPKQQQRRGRTSAFGQRGPDNGGGGDEDEGPEQLSGLLQSFLRRQGPDRATTTAAGMRESARLRLHRRSRGYIITNNHVIDKADKIYVKLSTDPDGGPSDHGRPATVIGVDKDTDIAVIKIDANEPLPTVKLGNSDGAQVGDWVVAIGSPFALSQTVTAGIVSAKNRTIEPGAAGQFQHFIQTDAAINPGNSGGPLVDMAGEVIGMNTAIYTQSVGYQGVGFAMPSNTIVSVYNKLIGPEHKVIRGSIGITFQPEPAPAVDRVYGFKNGVLVSTVQPGGPADKAGLKAGDIIISIDGTAHQGRRRAGQHHLRRKVGSTVQLGYLRDGKNHTANVTIGDRAKMLEVQQKWRTRTLRVRATMNEQAKLGLGVTRPAAGRPRRTPRRAHPVRQARLLRR